MTATTSSSADATTVGSAPSTQSARLRILDHAAQLILESGFSGTSMRDIAAAVGVKAGSLYHHFASKEEIFTAILNRGIDVMVAAFEAVSADEELAAHGSPEQLLHAHIRAHLGSLFEFGPYTAAHVTTFHSAPAAVYELIVPRRDGYEAMWAGLFEGLKEQGSLDVADTSIARLVLFGGMNSTIEWFDPDGERSLDDLASAIASQFWHGVANPAQAINTTSSTTSSRETA